MSCLTFGQFFKETRIKQGLTLRKFCSQYGLDAGNISRLERGKAKPPHHEKLEQYAEFLQIEKDSNDWYEFFDSAAACSGEIPNDLLQDEKLVAKLPLVYRTLRRQKVSPEKLDDFIELIRKT
ncbi:MAG: helix-turn-helix domain-containing protein [Candidatus Anammoxibacter sp.]